MNRPKKVIFHCASTPDTIESKFDRDDVDRWHKDRGWKGIGYHYYITREGEVQEGRKENQIGAHTKGQNKDSLGICYEGSHFPSAAQWLAVINLYRTIRTVHGLTHVDWYGHQEFANKSCPGFDPDILRSILAKVQF
jgi:N-acetylmuramoyl-L-alanine amidase